MTLAMKIIAYEVYQYLRVRYQESHEVIIRPFNQVTLLLYYQKAGKEEYPSAHLQTMLGFHTDNVYSKNGLFLDNANSQMEDTFT